MSPSSALSAIESGSNLQHVPPALVLEWVAARESTSVYIYDLAEQVGIGGLTKEIATTRSLDVVSLQTRSGAGLLLVGKLSDSNAKNVVTAYNTPSGVAAMADALASIQSSLPQSRLVIHVPTVSHVGEALALSPSVAELNPALNLIPNSFSVIFSATPQEVVDFASLVYKLRTHVLHVYDHHGAAREIGSNLSLFSKVRSDCSIHEGLEGAGYKFFDYIGDKEAHTVLVLLNGPLALITKRLVQQTKGLGVLVVRVLRPWDAKLFNSAYPSTTSTIHVVDDVLTKNTQGPLYQDVLGAISESGSNSITVHGKRFTPEETTNFINEPESWFSVIKHWAPSATPVALASFSAKRMLFVGSGQPSQTLADLPSHVFKTFVPHRSIHGRFTVERDAFSKLGGITASRIYLSTEEEDYLPLPAIFPVNPKPQKGLANFLAVLDATLMKTHAFLDALAPSSALLVFSSGSVLDLIPLEAQHAISQRKIATYQFDYSAVIAGSDVPNTTEVQTFLGYLAFLQLYLGQASNESLLLKLSQSKYGSQVGGVPLEKLNSIAWKALRKVDLGTPQPILEETPTPAPLKTFQFNSINVESTSGSQLSNLARLGSWRDAAKHIIFQDMFVPKQLNVDQGEDPSLRPEIPDRTFLVTCTVNRRLTPKEYDRNVFHLEFDTSGTGLKYAIGEALGVHGWNDAQEVLEFCNWFGADPNKLVTMPIPSSDNRFHTRTVFQALQQQIDIFGRPPKSFYSLLADHASRREDKMALQFIGSPEGSSTFKKLSEKDTVTFADVLKMYPSARPRIELLCEMIGDIKPRHYSIASAQSVVGDRVDLLVVTVEWDTPSGSPRYGQCTRYLADLNVGQKVTVSIKPSVMKLPPDNMQPLILAGLGTGAAPFRAFLQQRGWLSQQNIPVGPLYYYFGSRHRSQEYLYGEEIEAFILDKVITKAGLAFSRDDKKKVYIQHKMQEDAEKLARMLHDDNGVFYLCGPTWPVPDVYEALVGALVKNVGMEQKDAGDYLEGLKEEERYVLEVY